MSSDIAIRVENLGKMYRIGRERPSGDSFLERAGNLATSPFQWLIDQFREPDEDEILWALKDVSFEVKRGEVLGMKKWEIDKKFDEIVDFSVNSIKPND